MIDYQIKEGLYCPHRFELIDENPREVVKWCREHLCDHLRDIRWDYEGNTIMIREPGDALLFWTRWA